jgi:hypothetical protein
MPSRFQALLLSIVAAGVPGCTPFHESSGTDAGHDAWTLIVISDARPPNDAEASTERLEGGDTWTVVNDNPDAGALRAVWGASATEVYAVGDNGAAFEWDGGQVRPTVLGTAANMYGVWGSGSQDVFAVGAFTDEDVAVIMHRLPVGWIEVTTTYPHGLRAVWGMGEMSFAAGYDGVILTGPSFAEGQQVEANPYIPLTTYAPIIYALSGTGPDNVMAAADVDTMFYFDGTRWHLFDDPVDRTRTYHAVFGAPDAGTNFFWGANYYGLWHFTGLANLALQLHEERNDPQDFSRFIWSIWGLSSERIVCVGDTGRIMTYDSVKGVKIHPTPTGRSLYGVWGTSFDDLWVVGDGQLLMHGKVVF